MGLVVGNTVTSPDDKETLPNLTTPDRDLFWQISFDCHHFHVSGLPETAPQAAWTTETATLQGEDVSISGAATTTQKALLQIAEEMVNSYVFNNETRVSTFTVPAGVTDVEAMKALNEYFRNHLPQFKRDVVNTGDLDWYEKLPEEYSQYCHPPRDYRQARQITITGVVEGTEGEKRTIQGSILEGKSLVFADPRDQAIAAALHACKYDGEDLFQELCVRGSVPGFVLLTYPGDPVTVGECRDTSRKVVAASGSPYTESKQLDR